MSNALTAMTYPEFVAARLQGLFDFSPSFMGSDDSYVGIWRYRLTVMRGKKYHRVVIQNSLDAEPNWDADRGASVHCFVDDEGNVYKAAGWKGPVKDARYNVSTEQGIKDFLANADPYGGYLYAGQKMMAV